MGDLLALDVARRNFDLGRSLVSKSDYVKVRPCELRRGFSKCCQGRTWLTRRVLFHGLCKLLDPQRAFAARLKLRPLQQFTPQRLVIGKTQEASPIFGLSLVPSASRQSVSRLREKYLAPVFGFSPSHWSPWRRRDAGFSTVRAPG